MEVLGFVGAVLGLIAAIINRKRIIVLRHEYPNRSPSHPSQSGPITIRTRFKRFCIAIAMAFLLPLAAGIFEGASGSSSKAVSETLMWPFGICLLVGVYQFLAMLILVFARLWR